MPGSIKSRVPVSGEALDRRAFLRGMMVTSAGLLVPKPVSVFVPEPPTLYVSAETTQLVKAMASLEWLMASFFAAAQSLREQEPQ